MFRVGPSLKRLPRYWLTLVLVILVLAHLAPSDSGASQAITKGKDGTEIQISPGKTVLETTIVDEGLDGGMLTDSGETYEETSVPPASGWPKFFTGAGYFFPTAMAIDNQNNVYVTGRTCDPNVTSLNWDYQTVKFDSAGTQVWPNSLNPTLGRFDGAGHGFDEARAIAVDDGGNVYVTGYSTGDGTGADFLTIKYDSVGAIQNGWPKSYDHNGSKLDDFAMAIAIDGSGKVYVTGSSEGEGTGWDYLTIRYNPDGSSPKVRRYNGMGNRHDSPCAIAVDRQTSPNVYVTGQAYAANGTYNVITIAYGGDNFERQWVKVRPTEGNDFASALAVAAEGISYGVYVTSASQVDTGYDYVTIKYDQGGQWQWAISYRAGDLAFPKAIAVDKPNSLTANVYVTGLALDPRGAGTGMDYATPRYLKSDGDAGPTKTFNASSDWDETVAIAADENGHYFVAGTVTKKLSDGTTNTDMCTIRYNCNDNTKVIYRPTGPEDAGVTAMVLDHQNNNIYVTGFSTSSQGGRDYKAKIYKYPNTP